MFRRISLVLTDPELRTKLLKIILLLIAARLLAHVPIPLIQVSSIADVIDNDQVFSLLNTISGGAYGRLSFVMLGVGPYITSSIVMQLLGVIVPKIREIQREEGEQGRQKINRWTRILTVPLAALNAWGILQFLSNGLPGQAAPIELPEILTRSEVSSETAWAWFAVIASMTAGSVVIMWIGEIITEFKMGNGISLMILAGIVSRLPEQIADLSRAVWPDIISLFERVTFEKFFNIEVWKALLVNNPEWQEVRIAGTLLFTFFVTLGLVIFVNDAVRKILVIYSRRGHTEGKSRMMDKVKADLPVKVNMAGVLPIIFAVSFILFPTIISRFFFTANIPQVQDTARQVETFLSIEQSFAVPPEDLPDNFAGFYFSSDPEAIQSANNYDPTIGQELLVLQIANFKVPSDFTLPQEPSEEDLKLETAKNIKNNLFGWQFNSFNIDFLPEFALYFDGFLAYTLFYFLLIIFFTYFYTSTVAFKTDDVADNLQKAGAYIPGYRPGQQTMDYLSYVSNRLNVAGSLFLAIIATIPLALNNNITIGDGTLTGIVGGTTLLILVSVTIETLKQIEAQATGVDYQRFTKY